MKFWPHQQYTIDKFSKTGVGLDLSDPGTGKTATHIGLYAQRKNRGRLLVTCPMTLMASAWGNDIDRFFPELTYSLATAKNRFEAFEAKTDVVILNVDGIKAITQKFKTTAQLMRFFKDFDHLVMDEVPVYKHASSGRSKSMLKASRHFTHKFGLSGTPNPISVTELWHPGMLIDGGERLGSSFYRFRNAMQEAEQIGPQANHLQWTDKPAANDITMELLRDILVRHAFEEVMTDVPPNHVDFKTVKLPPKLWKQYQQLEEEAMLLLESGDSINSVHAAALRTKLLQLCSGAVYTSDGKYALLDSYRYELAADLVEEVEHSVTFFNWRHQRDELMRIFDKRGFCYELIDGSVPDHERPGIVKAYQNGEFDTLLIHPKTGAHGLTLTRGTRSILCSPMYEADYFKQTIHRIYRGGQTQVTNTLCIGAENTVEMLVYEKLRNKKGRMDNFLRLVQELKGQ